MKKIMILLAVMVLMTTVSCKKFLQEDPYDFISKDKFYKTEADANAALNGVISIMQLQQYYGRTVWVVNDLTGDQMKVGLPQTNRPELYSQTYTSTNGEISNWWNNSYVLINRANDMIGNVAGGPIAEGAKNNLLGNARFLRALAYFDLVRSFGEVPLLLKATEGTDDLRPSRSPLKAVYEQIVLDLKFAEANCVTEDKIPAALKGRVSSGAASALLAKVYLTRASGAAAIATDYQDALAACNKVIALSPGVYTLLPFAEVFNPDKKAANKEEIFTVQFGLAPNVGTITPRMHLPKAVAPFDGNEAFYVENAFALSYSSTDLRKAATIGVVPNTANFYYLKFTDPSRQGNSARNNWVILRYADVLLMQSEAMNQINSADPNKFNGINAVRNRAGLLPLSMVTTPGKDEFVTALVEERGWEFAAEGQRRYDLLRLGRMKQQQLKLHNIVLDDKYLLMPVPETERTLNPNLSQNTGF
ncbi:RagB/SusD family nutrient uptake outer membrane protein [Pedobacter sp. FW305-3-2-15-E-R2A2]|uniref:RagB/SusD family nutrient uptake outer membrane protein n=1 Tax=Pedobacter sp. FW305-3-2-15-E-R2A2 TaxID=3140251 RepID=UPI003140A455